MSVTYTTAARRDVRRLEPGRPLAGTSEVTLAAVSLFSIVLIALTAAGRVATLSRSTDPRAAAPVNLNTVTDAATLARALAPVLEESGDSRLAAHELLGYLAPAEGGRRVLPNVGAVAAVRVPAGTIDPARDARQYRARLHEERELAESRKREPPATIPLFTSAELAALKPAFVVRDRREWTRAVAIAALSYVVAFQLVSLFWRFRRLPGDRVLLVAAHVLTAIGFALMLSRPDPLRDQLLFSRYTLGIVVGLAAAAAVALINVRTAVLRELSYIPLAGALLLSILLIVFGSGPGVSSAKVNLGPVQPIEGIRLLLALFLAGYFARRWELLRAVRGKTVGNLSLPSWLNVPRAAYVMPVIAGVAGALVLFFFQKDLGPALMLATVFLAAYAVARGRVLLAVSGYAALAAGFYVGYRLEISATLADRVRMWLSPWDNAARGGDQLAHGIWAMATGGVLGTGPGLGDIRYLPAGHTDLVLAGAGEELGLAGLIVCAAVYAAIVGRAFATARRASSDYAFFLALVLGLFFCVPVLIMAAGISGLAPLTGVVTPFLSYGGSAMLANFIALGLLAAIRSDVDASKTGGSTALAPFGSSLRCLSAVLLAAFAVVVGRLVWVQAVAADELLVRPHLGLQADGARRYQYNPRVLDVARQIPRGTIFDRAGLPLATGDESVRRTADAALQRLGISLRSVCPNPDERCYPLGSRAFHLLGDAGTRVNWSASNSGYIERDFEANLRGFDARQLTVRVDGGSGAEMAAVRRDYRELLPLVRHRHEPAHPSVTRFLSRPRDIRVTIDAAFQMRVTAILASHLGRSATGHAAAVVIDPDTGDLLASVSLPMPSAATMRAAAALDATSRAELLDRARYGLYPPGSTFKLLTAAAALRRDPAAARQFFTCARLPDGRIGAKLSGWARPIRDDVLNTTPHGSVDLHRAFVVSCNAYFAQLAIRLGPDALLDVAERADVSVARGNDLARVRRTIPQVGYGQAEVLATPLRMARVAGAVASDGLLRDVRVVQQAESAGTRELLPVPGARLLARYMRDAVLNGTGRSLRGHTVPVAGKTGTAEVAGAPSHAWFVGFAPYGPATHRIALAVILENAGYGGTAAAPVAGEIISAAAAAGLIR